MPTEFPHGKFPSKRHQTQDRLLNLAAELGNVSKACRIMGFSRDTFYLGSQDTFYVGAIKGVGRIYQQTFVDAYSKWAAAKLCTTKTPITGAELLNAVFCLSSLHRKWALSVS